ncbi:hypothetical protein GCM10010278_36640 [Streptomyces melanogenes]|nr:hypothetical protein GCM10010278_36640 [Streptomyces melanogenes]
MSSRLIRWMFQPKSCRSYNSQQIAEATGSRPDDYRCAALAHFALETSAFAHRTDDPERAMDAAFALLQDGWGAARRGTRRTGPEPFGFGGLGG